MRLFSKVINNSKSESILFLHGTLGSYRNLSGLSANSFLNEHFNMLLVDLRNHGNSFHSPDHSILSNTQDICDFLEAEKVASAHIIGHSFGAKIGIQMALSRPESVKSLVLLDMGPNSLRNLDYRYGEVYGYLKQMSEMNMDRRRDELEQDVLKIAKGNKALQGFFLTNLVNDKGRFKWRANVQAIFDGFREVYEHVYPPTTYNGPVLEIAGRFSPYVRPHDLIGFLSYFPKFDINLDSQFLDCGHNVHTEKSAEVNSIIEDFYRRHKLVKSE